MHKDLYQMTQDNLLLAGGILSELDLEGMLQDIADSHAMAPMLDPTLYREGLRKLQAIEGLARAALGVQKAFAKAKAVYGLEGESDD